MDASQLASSITNQAQQRLNQLQSQGKNQGQSQGQNEEDGNADLDIGGEGASLSELRLAEGEHEEKEEARKDSEHGNDAGSSDHGGNPNHGPDGRFASSSEGRIAQGQERLKRCVDNQADELDAMHRPELGPISFLWGDDKGGIKHIIKRRTEEGQDVQDVLNRIPGIIEHGNLASDPKRGKERFVLTHDDHKVIVSPNLFGGKMHWVVTGYPIEEKNGGL